MRSTVVLAEPPLSEGRGASRCAVAMMRGLVAHGVEVNVVAARQHFAIAGEPPPDLRVRLVPVAPEKPGWVSRAGRLRRPVGEIARSPDFTRALQYEARDAHVVHLEEIDTAWCDERVRKPSVMHIHYLVRQDRDLGLPWRPGFRHVTEFALAERLAAKRHRFLVANSPAVARQLREWSPKADVVVVPLALDPADYPEVGPAPTPVCGVIGTASWPPTAAAMRRLVKLWPLVRRHAPDAELLVAGRHTEELDLGLDVPGVTVLGEVPSTRAFLSRLSVFAYPIERGSGTKVKVMEALVSGLPVVTTASGAEGVHGGDGVVVRAEPDDLAKEIAELLFDQAQARERGRAGREAFLQHHAPAPATVPLVDLYARIAG